MVQKRPRFDEDLYSFCSKLPRQIEQINKCNSFSEDAASWTARTLVDQGLTNKVTGDHERLVHYVVPGSPVNSEKNLGNSNLGGVVAVACSNDGSGETSLTASPVWEEYSGPVRPTREGTPDVDIYSLFMSYPSIKKVPIGSNHQADIPNWDVESNAKATNDPDSHKAMSGTCVVSMPDLQLPNDENTKTLCECLDKGSIRCVRQHVIEARDELMENLGEESFVKLGFYEMGEQVASRWTEEEEESFHEVVLSNPVSLGKCFWNHLPHVFPGRTMKDLVSYYFNVFMLRKRAEQNRSYPLEIDSDNDELDDIDSDKNSAEEEDDSDVNSTVHQNGHVQPSMQEDVLDVADDSCCDFASLSAISIFSEPCLCSDPTWLVDKIYGEEEVNQEIQDDSFTSDSQGNWATVENGSRRQCSGCEYTTGRNEDRALYPCDSKVWDTSFMICRQGKVDFLPTCSMIEEFFGDGSADNDSTGGNDDS